MNGCTPFLFTIIIMNYKSLFLTVGLFLFSSIIKAQSWTFNAEDSEFIPTLFTKDGKAKLAIMSEDTWDVQDGKTMNVDIYNDSFEKETSFHINGGVELVTLYFYDIDENMHDDIYFYATQTLFNDDEKYEYVIYSNNSYQVINSDNEIVCTLDITPDYYYRDELSFCRWGGKYYFFKSDNDDSDNIKTTFCLYDRNAQSVKKVESAPMMTMMRQIAKKNEAVEIVIAEEAVKDGGEIIVTDMGGRNVYSRDINIGESKVLMPVRRLSSGVYNVSFVTKGKRIESSKLIVR